MAPGEKKISHHHYYDIRKKNVLIRSAINVVPGGAKSLNTALHASQICWKHQMFSGQLKMKQYFFYIILYMKKK